MTLVKLALKPGITRDSTAYTGSGGWYNGNRIRFRGGQPESIGGWTRYTTEQFVGTCRSLFRFADLTGNVYTGLGSTVKYFIESGGQLTDVTPVSSTASLNNAFSTTSGSPIVTVADTAHGASAGDYIIISGSAAIGGITPSGEYIVTSVVDANTYTITHSANASSTVAGGGGASISISYLYPVGTDSTTLGTGWGTGTWGRSTWGSGSTSTAVTSSTRIWYADNFGEDLIVNPRNGGIFYWDATTPTTRMVALSTLSGDANIPTIATKTLVSQHSRHVVALGCDPLSSATQNNMLIRWSDQEDAGEWTPSTTNQAGDYQLNKGSKIITGLQTRSDILIFTDKALYNMQYIGGQLVFGFTTLADNIYIAGSQAAVSVNDAVYWMANSGFYVYNGRVQPIACTIQDFVLQDVDWDAADKIYACTNNMFHEVTWFYQSSGATEVDSYVTYNYVDNLWYFGELPRTAWVDDPGAIYPIAASTDGYLYTHEFGTYAEESTPGDIGAWIESSPIEIRDGEQFAFVDRFIPDVDFSGSEASAPEVTVTLSNANWPGGEVFGAESKTVVSAGSTHTNKRNVRLRGRSIKLKIASSAAGTRWRSGTHRIDVREDGNR